MFGVREDGYFGDGPDGNDPLRPTAVYLCRVCEWLGEFQDLTVDIIGDHLELRCPSCCQAQAAQLGETVDLDELGTDHCTQPLDPELLGPRCWPWYPPAAPPDGDFHQDRDDDFPPW